MHEAEGTQERATTNRDRKERIKWPASSEKKEWQLFEEEFDQVLEITLAGTVERKIAAMATLTYSMAESRFGIQEKKEARTKPDDNRRYKALQGSFTGRKTRYG